MHLLIKHFAFYINTLDPRLHPQICYRILYTYRDNNKLLFAVVFPEVLKTARLIKGHSINYGTLVDIKALTLSTRHSRLKLVFRYLTTNIYGIYLNPWSG